MRIRITKEAAADKPVAPTPDTQDYLPGQLNPGKSLPAAYTIEGDLGAEIQIGKGVIVFRDTRNGVKEPGLFGTTPVLRKGDNWFETENSRYVYEMLT